MAGSRANPRSYGGNKRAERHGPPAGNAANASWMLGPVAGGGGFPSVSNGNSGGPAKGALINATERNTSGRTTAHQAATEAPKSCPTTAATERLPGGRVAGSSGSIREAPFRQVSISVIRGAAGVESERA